MSSERPESSRFHPGGASMVSPSTRKRARLKILDLLFGDVATGCRLIITHWTHQDPIAQARRSDPPGSEELRVIHIPSYVTRRHAFVELTMTFVVDSPPNSYETLPESRDRPGLRY